MSRFYELPELPELPEGWYYETCEANPDVLHVVWPDHGAGSINFRFRTVDRGWCIPYPDPLFRPEGRGWKDRLVRSAIAVLQGVTA